VAKPIRLNGIIQLSCLPQSAPRGSNALYRSTFELDDVTSLGQFMLLKKPGFQSLGDLYLRPKLERLFSPLRIQVDQFIAKVDLAEFQIQDRPVGPI